MDQNHTGSSRRPDDPDVIARKSGKTTLERSTPSQRHERGSPPDDDDDDDAPPERRAGDVMLGATAIAEHLTAILGVPIDEADVYYAHRMKKLPIGKYGALLIASKRRLARHADELSRGSVVA
jgi:hypothetical protein